MAVPMSRPIIYGARYYLAGRWISRFHLYRCEPDGSRRIQITNGKHNDVRPAWSLDGKRIAFVRDHRTICTVPAEGGRVRDIGTAPNGVSSLRWEGRSLRCESYPKDVLVNLSTGDARTVAKVDKTRVRLRDGTQVSVSRNATLTVRATQGTERSVKLAFPKDAQAFVAQTIEYAVDAPPFRLAVLPGRSDVALVELLAGESTYGHTWSAFAVDLATGVAQHWGSHHGLHWSPEGKRFCTTLTRDYPDFDRRPNGETRTVEVCPLYVARTDAADKPVAIVKGFVYVDGCDWKPR